jgi:hypothetical protein
MTDPKATSRARVMAISQSPGWATLTSSTDSGAMQAANSAALTL